MSGLERRGFDTYRVGKKGGKGEEGDPKGKGGGDETRGGILDARRRVGGRTAILVCLDGIMGVGCVCVCGSIEGVLLHLQQSCVYVCVGQT